MISIFKIKCKCSIDFGKSGTCTKAQTYMARLSKNKKNVLILTDKNRWAVAFDIDNSDNKFDNEFDKYFEEVSVEIISNKKSLSKLNIKDCIA